MTQKYGLLTSISLVIGIVIGSGIFFKADDILVETQGSILVGVIGFIIIAIGVICSSLVISQYSILDKNNQGMMHYAKTAFGYNFSFIFGVIIVSVFFPALSIIISYVLSIYINELYIVITGNENSIFSYTNIILIVVLSSSFIFNLYYSKFTAMFQSITTIAKVGALLVISIVGIMSFENNIVVYEFNEESFNGLFPSLISIAFAFDGWIVATSVASQIKNPKKNLPIALVLGVIIISIIYILYFISISLIVGPQEIINLGDSHPGVAAQYIMGDSGPVVLYIFICISVMGALNGIMIGYMRLTYNLIHANIFKNKYSLGKLNKKIDMPLNSALVCIFYFTIFYILHLFGFSVDEIPMAAVYILYCGLYIGIFKLIKQKKVKWFYSIFSIIAIIISMLILYGSKDNIIAYLIIIIGCFLTMVSLYNKEN